MLNIVYNDISYWYVYAYVRLCVYVFLGTITQLENTDECLKERRSDVVL
jgi:hypothetical protein